MKEIEFRVWDRKACWYSKDFDDLEDFFGYSEYDCIEQYTGLKDKNGVKIFEGDTLKNINDIFSDLKGETICKIIYQGCSFVTEYETGTFHVGGTSLKEYEVIGNIHE